MLLCVVGIHNLSNYGYSCSARGPQHAKVRTRVALANTWTNARIVVHATGCSRYKWLKAKRRLSINNAAPSPLLGIFFLARLDYEMKGIIKVTLTSKLPTK